MARISKKKTTKCLTCGIEFRAYASKGVIPKFCGRKCYRNRPLADMTERFWSKVKKSDRCWEWQGSTTRSGYGVFNKSNTNILEYAHRFSWKLANGADIPDGYFVCHHCDNPKCVRPDHLFIGTPADNIHDSISKGRASRGKPRIGESNPIAKLTDSDVRAIRSMYSGKRGDMALLAATFGVTITTISYVIKRKVWKHVR